MNAKSLVAVVAVLTIVVPVRSDTPKPQAAAAAPVEQMIAELKQIAELVKQLDDNNFAKRQEASERLMRMGKPAVEPLQRLLAAKPSLELATRIQAVLREIKKKPRAKNKLRETLAQRTNLEKGIDANTPLKDALEFLSDRYDFSFIIDIKAFDAIGVQKVEEQPVALPKMVGVPLRTVLHILLKQLQGDEYHGTYLVLADRIEVTTTFHANPENWQLRDNRRCAPKVHAEFDGEALEDALRELVDSTGISVVIDRRVKEKAHEQVTATLNGVPLHTAVRMLADMAGLKMVVMHNALYVTSKENAKELETEKQERLKRERPPIKEAEKKQAQGPKKEG